MKKEVIFIGFFSLMSLFAFSQGPYAPPVGQSSTTAIHKDSSAFIFWSNDCVVTRGLQDISNASLGNTTVGTSSDATNKSGVNGIVSLGDGGSAILTFSSPITNGFGADFAVFENSFSNGFLELAFVEVSSDGINFFRFDAISLTDTSSQTGSFGTTDATNLHNLAGKYKAQYGTPFDLNELAGITGLNINGITHVKVIDVVGSINVSYANYDSQGRPINDPWPTAFASGGFDLDAVGVIHSGTIGVDESLNEAIVTTYPNPVLDILNVKLNNNNTYSYSVLSVNGKTVLDGEFSNGKLQIDLNIFRNGIYYLKLTSDESVVVKRIIKH